MMQDREYEISHLYYPKPITGGNDIMDICRKVISVDEFGKAMRGRKRNRKYGKRKR